MLTKYVRVFLSLIILICVISSISYAAENASVKQGFDEIRELYNEKPKVRSGNLSDKDTYTYNITELVYYNKTPEALDYATKYWRGDNYPRIDNRQLLKTLTDIAKVEDQIKNYISASEKLWNQGDAVKAKKLLSWVMSNTPNIDLTTDMIYGTNLTRAMQSYTFVTESVGKTLNAMKALEGSNNGDFTGNTYNPSKGLPEEVDEKALQQWVESVQNFSEFMDALGSISGHDDTGFSSNSVEKNNNQSSNNSRPQRIYWTCAYHPHQRHYSTRMPGEQGCSYSPNKRHSWSQNIE